MTPTENEAKEIFCWSHIVMINENQDPWFTFLLIHYTTGSHRKHRYALFNQSFLRNTLLSYLKTCEVWYRCPGLNLSNLSLVSV